MEFAEGNFAREMRPRRSGDKAALQAEPELGVFFEN